ncbi:MAG: fibronectin type III domain-containing protein, partial [Acidimicrobiales bacterium]
AAPNAPTGTSGNASATVNWVAPTDVGSSPITGYVLTPYIGSTAQTAIDLGNVTTRVVTGLTNGTAYTFTVAAINSVGTILTSPFSSPITPAGAVPGAPTGVTATAGKGSVKLTWKAPASDGGSTITHYVIKPSTGSSVTVGDVTSDTITKLTNGHAYTFTVAATNASGTGPASAPSKSVTPNGLYITTKSLPKGTKGKKYATVHLAAKNGKGAEKWTATGLPKGLTLSSAGILSGTVSSSDGVKTYTVTITVKDSTKPTKQSASTKFKLVVLK